MAHDQVSVASSIFGSHEMGENPTENGFEIFSLAEASSNKPKHSWRDSMRLCHWSGSNTSMSVSSNWCCAACRKLILKTGNATRSTGIIIETANKSSGSGRWVQNTFIVTCRHNATKKNFNFNCFSYSLCVNRITKSERDCCNLLRGRVVYQSEDLRYVNATKSTRAHDEFLLTNFPIFAVYRNWWARMDRSDTASKRWAKKRGYPDRTHVSIVSICRHTRATINLWRNWIMPSKRRKDSGRSKRSPVKWRMFDGVHGFLDVILLLMRSKMEWKATASGGARVRGEESRNE